MNYKRIYNELIINRQNNPLPKETYTEKHHIIPKSHGGSNEKDNLVSLSAREHFIAHWLLWRIHRDSKMAHAFNMMCTTHKNKRYMNSHGFEEARKFHSIAIRKLSHSKETRLKISESQKGDKHWAFNNPMKPETKDKIRASLTGYIHTIETRNKLSIARSGIKNWAFGKTFTDEHKLSLSISHSGIKFSEEHKKKIGNSIRGDKNGNFNREFTDEHREKIRLSRIGTKSSDETKKKLSDASKEYWRKKREAKATLTDIKQ